MDKKVKCGCLVLGEGTLVAWQKAGAATLSSISIEGGTWNVPKKAIGRAVRLVIEFKN